MKIYCYGDSLTYGYAPDGICGGRYPADIRWTGIITAHANEGVEIIADGQNGREIPGTGEMEFFRLRRQLREQHFGEGDLFVVLLGTNDVIDEDMPTPSETPERIAKKMEDFLVSLGVLAKQVILICPGTVHPHVDFCNPNQREDVSLTEAYRCVADKFGCRFASVDGWKIEIGIDGVHFSERGHRDFAKHMRTLLGRGILTEISDGGTFS